MKSLLKKLHTPIKKLSIEDGSSLFLPFVGCKASQTLQNILTQTIR